MRQANRLPPAQRDAFLKANSRTDAVADAGRWTHIWHWFIELSEGRGEGFSGPAPITHEAVLAWRANTGAKPRPLEIRLIFATDSAWRAEWHRLQKLKTPKG